jgi:hypothetical protein
LKRSGLRDCLGSGGKTKISCEARLISCVGIVSLTREVEMATIRAVIPAKLLSQLCDAADPNDTSVEETVQGAIQATLPTAEVRYSEDASEVMIQIGDEEIVTELLGLALYELKAAPISAGAVNPGTVEAKDAQLGTSSQTSPLITPGH